LQGGYEEALVKQGATLKEAWEGPQQLGIISPHSGWYSPVDCKVPSKENAVVWDVLPCGFNINRRLVGMFRFHLQGRRSNESEEKCLSVSYMFLRNVGL
jgi:hypothetical protein